MEATKFRFWLKLALVVMTSFIVITYIFKPSDNQCQMTFMMEPPRFIPTPIDAPLYNLDADQPIKMKQDKQHGYKLFMYSEFGFPLEHDVRRDLKDSMPVLFVPGNAGSYQQVRSLASTCIRRQLQALDAFKFIFYTIDFRAQLSGLSGELIEDQIDFLDAAIKQIVKIHPTETGGVIVVGHSVGGFVAKALLARSSFEPSLVPLLINLASPLTRPFVNFDYKMQQLYNSTNALWPEKQVNSNTLTISISGGKSDRLVPVHLSLDSQYDISLTTSSIDGVWLTTDHVSITWCRELMHKLSRLLSSLMDKKRTKLVAGKSNQLAIVKTELLTASPAWVDQEDITIKPEQRVISSHDVKQVDDYIRLTRKDLMESSIILNLTQSSGDDLFIWIEHIDSMKETAIFGCQEVGFSVNQARCEGRANLMEHFRTIPSRRHELKKRSTAIRDYNQKFRYLTLYFVSPVRDDPRANKIPESISVQVIKRRTPEILQVPNLSSYLLSTIFRSNNLVRDLRVPVKQPNTLLRYEISNLQQANQYFNIIIKSTSCTSSDTPSEIIALLLRNHVVAERFYTNADPLTVIVKLEPHDTILLSEPEPKLHLELYLDGTCEHKLRIEFDTWSFIENIIQVYPGEILACSCYLAYCSILVHTYAFLDYQQGCSCCTSSALGKLLGLIGYALIYLTSRLSHEQSSDTSQQVLVFCVVSFMSAGLVALVDYVVNRLVDLATVVNNFQTLIRNKIVGFREPSENKPRHFNGSTGASQVRPYKLDYEWPVVFLSALAGLFLSEALMRLCVLFMMLKLKLKLSLIERVNANATKAELNIKDTPMPPDATKDDDHNRVYNMGLAVTTLCIISSICSIPTTLLMINSAGISLMFDINYLASLGSMIATKSISQEVELHALREVNATKTTMLKRLLSCAPKYLHLLGLVPMMLVSRNIRVTNQIELITLIWVAGSLSKSKLTTLKEKTD